MFACDTIRRRNSWEFKSRTYRIDQLRTHCTAAKFGSRISLIFLLVTLGLWITTPRADAAVREEANVNDYVEPQVCAGCHRQIWETYRETGMGQSFASASSAPSIEDFSRSTFYHEPSDSYFSMFKRDGRLFQRRYQLDARGNQVNVMEKQVDYIMGSGMHSRAYLNRTARGKLIELPLAWYAEQGGYWAMNPGYDRPDHEGFRRPISYDCMFCHNSYPSIPAGHEKPFSEPVYLEPLPTGIDCQRCHGPGRRHTQLASSAHVPVEIVRSAIVNPARLSSQRQLEGCMVCHLESTSFPLPNALQRYDREPFSYQPGEPLESFLLNFDHTNGTGRNGKFEFVSAAYRLRRSICFLKSNGRLGCTTCHNPHDIPRGDRAAEHYKSVCLGCHSSALAASAKNPKHPQGGSCIGCHMPKRRTEDVVHAMVTDHLITRNKPAQDLLAPISEHHEEGGLAYRGPVVPYYPEHLPATANNDLYLAVAQVKQNSNLAAGIPQLEAAIKRYRPARPEFYFDLAEAFRQTHQLSRAISFYKEALERDPDFSPAREHLGVVLRQAGQSPEALDVLHTAASLVPDHPDIWIQLGLTYRALNKNSQAVGAFEKALTIDPESTEAHNNLGILWLSANDPTKAAAAFREAIRIRPDDADAQSNIASLLSESGSPEDALRHFEVSLRVRPNDALTYYNYAMALGRTRRYEDAQHALEESLRRDAALVDAHLLLADLFLARNKARDATAHYRRALDLRPSSGRARLGLGTALLSIGDASSALVFFREASSDSDPSIRDQASKILQQLKK
jgi:predicted CXXCH cytochrome family protein